MSAVDLPLIKLRARLDARAIDHNKVEGIAASVREIGIINPLRVRPKTIFESGREVEGWEITAGNHRFEAAKSARLEHIPCIIVAEDDLRAELAMIDENLCRSELSPADRAGNTARRKELYLILHPETRNGSSGIGREKVRQVGEANVAERFSADTAGATGRSERAVQRDAERGEKISERALAQISGTHLDTGAYLDKLKKLGPHEQEARVQRELAAPRAPISPAPAPRNEFESEQAWLAKVVKLFDAAPQEWRERARDHLFPDTPVMDRSAA